MNRCRRCNREISDPNAMYGWRCAEILGVSEKLSEMGDEVFDKFMDGVIKAQSLLGEDNSEFSERQRKSLYSAYAKMSLWDGVDDKKVKDAKKESYSILESGKSKLKSLADELDDYKDYIDRYGLISGTSRKLAKDEKLDDVTNSVMKMHDYIAGDTVSGKIIKKTSRNIYDKAHKTVAIKNYLHNKKVDLSSYKDGYINDQNANGDVAKLKFGTRTMDRNGCGVIAVYNTMLTLGDQRDIRDIAYHFENDGQVFGGEFGTNPHAIKRYFSQNGYKVKTIEGENIRDEKIPNADAYVLSYWNKRDVMDAMHIISVRKTKDGYELFNYGKKENNDSYEIGGLWKELMNKRRVPLVLHCISKE